MPAAISAMYATEVVSGYDLHKPEKLNTLFMRYGDQGIGYFQTLRSMGFEKDTANITYGHFEDDYIHETFHVKTNVADPGAGVDISITLPTSDLDSSNRFYPRQNDVVTLPNEVTGYIVSVDVSAPTAPVLLVRLNDETDTFGALTAGDELIITSSVHSEASGQPDPAFSGTYEYSNDVQIIKETLEVSGDEMTNQDWINVTEDGSSIPAFYYKGQKDIDYRMSLKIDGALLVQKRTTNPNAVDPDTGNYMYTTEGVIPYARRLGHSYPSTAGAFDVDDFDAIDRILDKENAGSHTMSMSGINRMQNIENALVTYFADTNIDYTRKVVNETHFGGVDSLGASVNFKYLLKSERTFMFKKMGSFNNAKTYGVSGYAYPDMSLMLPLNRKIKDKKDSANSGGNIGCRYKALGPYSRRMEVYDVGGAGNGLKVTQFDKRSTYQRAQIGAHNRKGNQFVLVHT